MLFNSYSGDTDIQKTDIDNRGEWVVTAGVANNGLLGRTSVKAKVFDAGTITVDMFGNAFYRNFRYKMVTHARVFSLNPKVVLSESHGIFFAGALAFIKDKYGFDNMCSWAKIKDLEIYLPTNNKWIDFDFIESFIAELEAQRIAELEAQRVAELEAYLKVTGLDNYELTDEEENALIQIYNSEWREFKAEQLFTKLKTTKLPYKAKDLPTAPSGNNVLPCLTSSFHNQGLNYYAPRVGATILKHVITVPSNSDVYRAYYQSREFTVLSDAYAIRWKDENRTLSFRQYLFMVQSINKITDLPIYSYKNKFGGWNTLKEQFIQLPVKDNEIDFELIELFVSAIVKTAIKDVVLYSQRKMSLYQRVSFKDKPVVYSIPKPVELRVAEDVPAVEYGKSKKNK